MQKTPTVLAVDLGGTNMRSALVSASGEVLARSSVPTEATKGPEAAMDRLATALSQLREAVPDAEAVALGMALAGPLDPRTGTLHHPPNLPGWDGFSAQTYLAERVGVPIRSHNDATLAALGEHAYGVGRGKSSLVFVAWGTGVGGGLVLNGQLYDGARGFAAEIGHLVLDPQGRECSCGSRGCLETYVAGPAMARTAQERLRAGEPSLLSGMVGGRVDHVRAETVAEAERQGDELARSVLETAGAAMGIGVASLRHLLDPDVVVIGGGVSSMLHVLYPALMRSANAYAMGSDRATCPVTTTALGDDAGLLGAAVVAWQAVRP